jgi:galactosylceramidase
MQGHGGYEFASLVSTGAVPRGAARTAGPGRQLTLGLFLLAFTLPALPLPAGAAPQAGVQGQAVKGLAVQAVALRGDAGGSRFDGIGVVNGGGATSVLLKDYPEPERSQILDMLYKPKFGASVGALLVEIPGDGNSTQGSMPSHMHTRDDLNYQRGYMWWILQQAKARNPDLTLIATPWSAPGWVGNGNFWSQDAADYDLKWLQGLKQVYGLAVDSIGVRNEKGVNFAFARMLRDTLNANGFGKVKVQGFDDWPVDKFAFVPQMLADPAKRDALDILSAHTLIDTPPADGDKLRQWAQELHKPVWNSEEHVYKKGFDAEISIVQAFNLDYILYGATLTVNWYDIAGLYPMEAYSETPAALLARSPWSGYYKVREALWGYAHYGQFTAPGWQYLNGGCGKLAAGGTYVTLKSPGRDYSIIVESKDAKAPQQVRFTVGAGLSAKKLNVWRSDAQAQFVQQPAIEPVGGVFTLNVDPQSIYSLSTTGGQQKGSFADIPQDKPFPLPYYETFESYQKPQQYGYLPRYTADIDDVFEIADCPEDRDHKGKCLHQAVPIPPISWAPEWTPYTVLGDEHWHDYEVSADIYLKAGDSGGVMGRINDTGSGYGTAPKGYILEMSDAGLCRLIVSRGKKEAPTTGDAEQQALLRKRKNTNPGGELVLGSVQLPGMHAGKWHRLKLVFRGEAITGVVDGRQVLSATDSLYPTGMAGLMAGGGDKTLSTPYYDNVLIQKDDSPTPPPSSAESGQTPIYKPLE